ncbi:MAG: hypothetical protein WA821_01740 [Anaerolineales bacterium]
MAFRKSSSPALKLSKTRLAALDPAFDLFGLTLTTYQASIQDVEAKLSAYNALLSQADEARKSLRASEKELSALSVRMLAGIGARYGKDSNEYKMAGGTRTSEIKRSPRKKKAAAPDPAG